MPKILIVDDEQKIREVIREYSEFNGYEVEEAADGMEAVSLCRLNDYDLIIMDIMMPKLDGYSACKEIKKTKNIPVIMLSARGEEYDKLFGFELGIDDYVVKPFSPKELMDNQIQRKKQQGQTNYIERIAVLSVELRGWCQEGGNDVLVARLNTRIVDYTLDDKTGKLISGSRDKEKFMVYEWDLVRTTGTKTEKDKPMQTVNCPNCGAPVEINASAKCPYCGSVITLEEHDFALNAIRAISQQTRG